MKIPEWCRKISNQLFQDLHQENWLSLFFLSVFVGLYTLICVIGFYLSGGITEPEETNIFILTWVLAPSFSILSVPLFLWIRSKFLKPISDAFLILLSVNSITLGFLITVINLTWQMTRSFDYIYDLTFLSIVAIPVINIIGISVLKSFHQNIRWKISWLPAILSGIGFINFVGIIPFFNNQYSIPVYVLLIAILGGVVGAHLYFKESNNSVLQNHRRWLFLIDFSAILLIFITCFDPNFAIDQHNQNFFLGPANQVLHGGTMLVNAFSQYGNLSIYFLALVLKTKIIPFTYQGFSLLITILIIGQFAIVYAMLCQLVKNRFYAIFLLVLSILLGFFCTMGISQTAPSTGPYRFGLMYLILGTILVRNWFPSLRTLCIFIEYFLVGAAFLWSFETFVYAGFPYLAICLFESFSAPISIKESIQNFLRRIFWFLLAIAAANLILIAFTYSRAQALPNWDIYLGFIKSYSSIGQSMTLSIDTWGPWIFPLLIYFTSLMIFVFRFFFLKYRGNTVEDRLIFGLTFFGIVQYTYFLGRSHPNNLFHISIAAVIIFGYWFYKVKSSIHIPGMLKFASKIVFFSTAITVLLTSYPAFNGKFQESHTGLYPLTQISMDQLNIEAFQNWLSSVKVQLAYGSGDFQVIEARRFIKKYMPEQKEIPIFLTYKNTTEVLFKNGRIHAFPIGDIAEELNSPLSVKRIMDYPSPLKNGDYMIIQKDPLAYSDIGYHKLAVMLLDRICHQFSFEEIESSNHGVLVVRLKPYDNSSQSYCEIINQINN